MHKVLVIRFYFPLDALHVSDYTSPSSGTSFSLMVLYVCILFAYWALINLTLYAPCIILQYVYKPTNAQNSCN